MISIYVRNKEICPASYYRITQYLGDFKEAKFNNIASSRMFYINQRLNREKVTYTLWKIVYFVYMTIRGIFYEMRDIVLRPNVVIVSRSIFPHKSFYFGRLILKIILSKAKIVIWDFDDDIFLNGEISNGERMILEKYSTKIIVTHEYLKSLLSISAQAKTITLPTTDGDFDKYSYSDFKNKRIKEFEKNINLVWVGQAVNLRYFDGIIDELDKCAKDVFSTMKKTMQLIIVCNQPLTVQTENLKITNILWSKHSALDALCKSHIGIMPLIDEKYTLGKGGFKLIQYMSSSLPVIGSNLGYNKEIIDGDIGCLVNKGEWGKAIISIVESEKKWKELSDNSRIKWEKYYAYESQKQKWYSFLMNNLDGGLYER